MDWKKEKVLIIGAGKQGTALARYLCGEGAQVILSDSRTEDVLQAPMEALADCSLKWVLGEHPLSLLEGTTLVCPSGGVPLEIPIILEAVKRGIPLSNDSEIFMKYAPCKVVGITGSAGKTTTTTLVGRMAVHQAETSADTRKAWVGGNIGNPLIADLKDMTAEDAAVVELSSFQTELMTSAPAVAAILNIAPNHLDRHGTMENYIRAKSQILKNQSAEDFVVLNREDPASEVFLGISPAKLISFGLSKPADDLNGTYAANETIFLQLDGLTSAVMPVSEIELRGPHNLQNVLAACALGAAAGFSTEAIRAGIIGFRGVEHRLEFVRELNGANWYNDSKATTPDAVMMSVQSFEEPIILLAGGRDKNLPWDRLVHLADKKVDHLILFGEAAPLIIDAVQESGLQNPGFTVQEFSSLHPAVNRASALAQTGDAIILAPGCTSFDEFKNFEERGLKFKEWVNEL